MLGKSRKIVSQFKKLSFFFCWHAMDIWVGEGTCPSSSGQIAYFLVCKLSYCYHDVRERLQGRQYYGM